MAPSAGHLHKLVMRNVKLIKAAWKNASQHLQSRLPTLRQPELQPIPVRAGTRQSLHATYISRSQARWYSTARSSARNFSSASTPGAKFDRASLPASKTFTAVRNLTGRAPFASTLRPNLTGGALGRTAGGYSLGSGRVGGARYFSHAPAAPAQVIQNVSQAVRAFLLSGQKAHYNGVSPHTGEKRYRAVSNLQHETSMKISSLPKATPGSFIDFSVNPTITAFTPLSAIAGYASSCSDCESPCNLNSDGLLDVLSADFSRALKDLVAVLNDLKSLSSLGDLPISYRSSSILRVHFPGCDKDTVENLCTELSVRRGVVIQDDDFDAFAGTEIALLFPFAPSEPGSELDYQDDGPANWDPQTQWQDKPLFPSSRSHANFSTDSDSGMELFDAGIDFIGTSDGENPCLSSPEPARRSSNDRTSTQSIDLSGSPLEYHDFEGIYRFIDLCDASRR